MVQGKPIIFTDETSFNLWDKSRIHKTWQLDEQPIRRRVNTQRLNNVTIYGSVSNFLPKLQFMLHKGTNVEGWKKYLLSLTK